MQRILILVALMAASGCDYAERAAERAATRELADPASAQFRGTRINDEGVVCGEVNGRNRLGTLTDFRKFIYYSHTGNSLLEPVSVKEAYEKADLLCRTSTAANEARTACTNVRKLVKSHRDHADFTARYTIDCS